MQVAEILRDVLSDLSLAQLSGVVYNHRVQFHEDPNAVD